MLRFLTFIIVVVLSNVIQCITGFAGTVLAMPFSVMLVGYNVAKPTLNLLGVVTSIGVLINDYKAINKREFFKIIAVMLVGIAGGTFITQHFELNPSLLYKLLGSVVIFFALFDTYLFVRKKTDKKLSTPIELLLLISSGLVHGMFVCGGPLLVTYASAKLKDTKEFRATLSAVWIVLNTIIFFTDFRAGYINRTFIITFIVLFLFLVLSILIGRLVSKRMNQKAFLILSYALMFISGISLFLK